MFSLTTNYILSMKVICFDPIMSKDEMNRIGISKMKTLDALLTRSDFISLHTPDIFQAEDLICKETIDKCKVLLFFGMCIYILLLYNCLHACVYVTYSLVFS